MAAERKAAEEPQGPGAGAAANTTVPQTLLQQANIEAILQTADELGKWDRDVARICMCKFILYPRFESSVGVKEFKRRCDLVNLLT